MVYVYNSTIAGLRPRPFCIRLIDSITLALAHRNCIHLHPSAAGYVCLFSHSVCVLGSNVSVSRKIL